MITMLMIVSTMLHRKYPIPSDMIRFVTLQRADKKLDYHLEPWSASDLSVSNELEMKVYIRANKLLR